MFLVQMAKYHTRFDGIYPRERIHDGYETYGEFENKSDAEKSLREHVRNSAGLVNERDWRIVKI